MTNTHCNKNNIDTLYSDPILNQQEFCFDQKVVDVFPDMIKRSVPGYQTVLNIIAQLAQKYVLANTHCYDLGCSLGSASLAMRDKIITNNVKIIGVDNSQEMITQCQKVIELSENQGKKTTSIELIEKNIEQISITNASLCVLNFTLQFVPYEKRQALLQKIYHGLNPGGIVIISEKVTFDDADYNRLMIELHHQFKKANGYSELEIAQKRNALDKVLIPETLDAHKARLHNIGFKHTDIWFQCFNFASFVAFK